MLKLFRYTYSIYAILMFIVTMLPVLLCVVIFSLFGTLRGGNLIYKAFNVWARVWYLLVAIRHKEIYEAPHDKSQQYIFVANHNSYMDVPPVVRCMHQPLRILGKYELSKYPLFGYIYRKAVVMVDRSSAAKRSRSVQKLKQFIRQGISVFIFPEGTFNETGKPLKSFYDGAFRIAIETGTPIKPLLLLDNIKRMHFSGLLTLTPGKSRVVFLKEISVEGYTLEMVAALKQHVYNTMETALLSYGFGKL